MGEDPVGVIGLEDLPVNRRSKPPPEKRAWRLATTTLW